MYFRMSIMICCISRSPEVTSNIPRPNLIPFTEPYAEGGSMNPASRLKALQGGSHRKHSSNPKPTSSNNDGIDFLILANVQWVPLLLIY